MIDTHVDVFVSVASVWEVGLKQHLGKIEHGADAAEATRDCDCRHCRSGSTTRWLQHGFR